MSELNKPSKQLLAELINTSNGVNYTPETLGLSDMEVYTEEGPQVRNTTAMAWHTSKPDRKFRIYWDRLALQDLITPNFTIPYDADYAKVEDLLPVLNEEFDLALAADDIRNDDIEPGVITIRANVASLVYISQVNVELAEPA